MPISLTTADVLQLAPDTSSAKSGQDLANLRKWVSLGVDEGALWGLCQGSGSKPYQTQLDLSEIAFKCSCPSRKFPCKHGIGLLLIFVNNAAAVPTAERPAWVAEWLTGRQARAEKKAAAPKEEKPIDAEAQAKRREKRFQRIQNGMEELNVWISDWMKTGIAAAPTKGFAAFDAVARRLVDAQAPGAARLVNELGSVAASGADWQRPFVERMATLHLLTRAVARIETLPDNDRANVLAALGVPVSQEELALLSAVSDTWQVVSRTVVNEDKLRVQRTWLIGTKTPRSALVLQFAHGTMPLDSSLIPGMEFDGEIVFYPGTGPRAAVRTSPILARTSTRRFGFDSLEDGLNTVVDLFAQNPWLERVLFPLRAVTPTIQAGRWHLLDSSGTSLPLAISEGAGWTLAALSGGQPIPLVCEFDGKGLTPLSVQIDGRIILCDMDASEAA